MGGNALKKFGVETRRVDAKEYDVLCNQVLRELGDCSRACIIPAYHAKETFGDMDVLYVRDTKYTETEIRDIFSPSAIYSNGDVISFDVDGFQIDLIHTTSDLFNYSRVYFSYNDIAGDLVGKIAHKFGLKHGHDGLWLPIRDGDNIFKNVSVSIDWVTVFDFLDLDVGRYVRGFDTLEEGFDWVSKSVYFDPEAYKLENLNHIAKVRDRKRTTYRTFLEYCEKLPPKERFEFNKDKSVYLSRIFERFHGAEERYNLAIMELAHQKYVRTLLNGDMVSEMTHLVDRELGMFMRYLRDVPELNKYRIVLLSQNKICDIIDREYNVWYNKPS